MSKLKLCPCAKCGNLPDVIDRRIRFVVICECQEPFNVTIGANVGFLDNIEDDEIAKIAFDSVNIAHLRESAIEVWNIEQRLISTTKQRNELVRLVRLVNMANIANYGKGVGCILNDEDSKSLRDVLSKID